MKSKYGLLKILLILLAVVICGVIYSCSSNSSQTADNTESSETTDVTGQSTEAVENDEISSSENLICVHVCGAVAKPGVYYLSEGSRIHQAIEMAGGLTGSAASDYVNLADVLSDGEQIYIPTIDEIEDGSYTASLSEISNDENGLVNINTADISELSTLPGIGQSKAEAIIVYRENVSQFESIEDIKNVSGIGDSVYEKIKDSIKVK